MRRGQQGGISRNGGQKVRARSEKRIGSVGSLRANHDAAARRNVLLVQGGADRGNFLRRKLTHKFCHRDSFFFPSLRGEIKSCKGEKGRYT